MELKTILQVLLVWTSQAYRHALSITEVPCGCWIKDIPEAHVYEAMAYR